MTPWGLAELSFATFKTPRLDVCCLLRDLGWQARNTMRFEVVSANKRALRQQNYRHQHRGVKLAQPMFIRIFYMRFAITRHPA